MVMDKKGYLKTLEAIIAIIIILLVVYAIIPKYVEPKPNPPLAVQDAQRFILSDISNNDTLRVMILTDNPNVAAEVQKTIQAHMLPNYDFACAICPQTSACIQPTPFDKTVYMNDIFIASSPGLTLAEQKPKIIRFWMWLKPTVDISVYNTCQVI